MSTLMDRLDAFIWTEPMSGCWLWSGGLNSWGYGQAWDGTRLRQAHRVVYEELVGPIPEGLQVDHLCRTRACVNPGHLEPVTARENTRRSDGAWGRAERTNTCKRGHDLTDAPDYGSGRQCGECRSIRRRKPDAEIVPINGRPA